MGLVPLLAVDPRAQERDLGVRAVPAQVRVRVRGGGGVLPVRSQEREQRPQACQGLPGVGQVLEGRAFPVLSVVAGRGEAGVGVGRGDVQLGQ